MFDAHESTEHRFWEHVRDQFVLEHPRVNLAAMSVAPHSRSVQRAIERYAHGLDTAGWPFLSANLLDGEKRAREGAAAYFFPGNAKNVALTDGTLQGLALMYAGLQIEPDQEILTSNHEFSHVYKIFASRQERERRQDFVRGIDLFEDLPNFSPERVVQKIGAEIRDRTRVLALTWVYSNTGVKLPIAAISELVRKENAGRSVKDRIIFCIDGVHGFGVEATTFPELGCDFFVSGCHKWIFGPRGTGVWLGTDEAWLQMLTIIPSTTGSAQGAFANTPGGLHSYELRWALDAAFEVLDRRIGKRRIQERVHAMATRVKEALHSMPHVKLVTPTHPEHSSGIICFDVKDSRAKPIPTGDAVDMLERAGVVATTSSSNRARPDVHHVRISVSILNSDDEIGRAIEAIGDLA
jgi:selenocysteine lyase/cysteine desulfurase